MLQSIVCESRNFTNFAHATTEFSDGIKQSQSNERILPRHILHTPKARHESRAIDSVRPYDDASRPTGKKNCELT